MNLGKASVMSAAKLMRSVVLSTIVVILLCCVFILLSRAKLTMSNIRVSLIRCDTHGLWYGPIMADHDPLLLQRPTDPREKHRYSWQAGGMHMFFYTNYGDPTAMTVPFVGGFEITQLWDADRDAAEQAKEVLLGVPQVCDSPDQCSDDVDLVFVADCNFDGSDHLELATPGLEKGVPTFG